MKWVRWIFVASILVLVVPVVEVGCVRWVNPPTTPERLRIVIEQFWLRDNKPTAVHSWTPLDRVPRLFLHYVWASEDQRFFEHCGIDFDEIKLALREADRSGDAPRGASTITQQCARSVFLWQGRSWIRKGLEVYYSLWMELLLSKRRIFELYVNEIEFGLGVYGVEAAAWHFYGKPAMALRREQLAMLAAVIAAPLQWNPLRPSPNLRRRQQRVMRLASKARFPDRALRLR